MSYRAYMQIPDIYIYIYLSPIVDHFTYINKTRLLRTSTISILEEPPYEFILSIDIINLIIHFKK